LIIPPADTGGRLGKRRAKEEKKEKWEKLVKVLSPSDI